MCVAVFKPKGAEVPSRDDLYNCFLRNSDGAGYAFFRDGCINIKKGYMSFNKFYEDFSKENFSKDENVFIHFRIATHGLVDEGNTHPFPLTDDFNMMRETNIKYHGKCLIHNGVFPYKANYINSFSNIISDTMLFAKLVFDEVKKYPNVCNNIESIVAKYIVEDLNDDVLKMQITKSLSNNKIAIMDENGNVKFFGNWIKHNNVYYSNSSYEGYQNTYYCYPYENNLFVKNPYYGHYDTSYRSEKYYDDLFDECSINKKSVGKNKKVKGYCDFCGNYSKKCRRVDNDTIICNDCIHDYNLKYCDNCHEFVEAEFMKTDHLCCDCYFILHPEEKTNNKYDDNETKICMCCGQNYLKSEESAETDICKKCYKMYCGIA